MNPPQDEEAFRRLAFRIRRILQGRRGGELDMQTIIATQRDHSSDEVQSALFRGIREGWWVNYPPGSFTLTRAPSADGDPPGDDTPRRR